MKSIGFPQLSHVWGRSNSSENISFFALHEGQEQKKDFRFLNWVNPGHCCGVVVIFIPPEIDFWFYVLWPVFFDELQSPTATPYFDKNIPINFCIQWMKKCICSL
ncbi:MAG: hypothetical protein KGY38_07985 [Desulfobacterales bacterium]|nr:hypothetical protein [Desulfobacterales bacterium]